MFLDFKGKKYRMFDTICLHMHQMSSGMLSTRQWYTRHLYIIYNVFVVPISLAEAPYLLEPLVESWATEPAEVRLALLTAAAKLFFVRAPEARKLLGGVLAAGLNDTQQDVHDRALLYYRWDDRGQAGSLIGGMGGSRCCLPELPTVPKDAIHIN